MLACVTLLTLTGGYTASAAPQIEQKFTFSQGQTEETVMLDGAYQLKVLVCENKGGINQAVNATFCVLNIPNLQTGESKSDSKTCGNDGKSTVSAEPIDDRTLVSCTYTQFKTGKSLGS
ncbi:MAG: hypothetical protein SWX82_07675 [Cyanobacteriota bacterium]|nr:hypothetical protein [Cyanobacteriota bacterium]